MASNKDGTPQTPQEMEDSTEQDRVRTLTERGEQHYEDKREHHKDRVEKAWTRFQETLNRISNCGINDADDLELELQQNYQGYNKTCLDFFDFLKRERTEESMKEWRIFEQSCANCEKIFKAAMTQIKIIKNVDAKSVASSSSRKLRATIKLEEVQAKLKLAEEEASIQKKKAEIQHKKEEEQLNAELSVLKLKKEAVEVEAEVKAASIYDEDERPPSLAIPVDQTQTQTTTGKPSTTSRMTTDQRSVIVRKTDVHTNTSGPPDKVCPIHLSDHSLNQCREFSRWDMKKRKDLLKKKGICFKCCASNNHLMKNCKHPIQCEKCDSELHPTALHVTESNTRRTTFNSSETANNYGGEGTEVSSKCTTLCGFVNGGRSCAKIVLAKVFPTDRPQDAVTVYVLLDDQSNHTLARSELLNQLGVTSDPIPYRLKSCAGWRATYLESLQRRRKWCSSKQNLKTGDIVLLREKDVHRNMWPLGIVERPIESNDRLVRKAVIRVVKDGKVTTYTRPIAEMVLLLE
uniref:DUF5641 domain-containing protein n=1 Tax=Magallana gigas TaxID=29159 RepID=A0A8W8P2E6_MAGGI